MDRKCATFLIFVAVGTWPPFIAPEDDPNATCPQLAEMGLPWRSGCIFRCCSTTWRMDGPDSDEDWDEKLGQRKRPLPEPKPTIVKWVKPLPLPGVVDAISAESESQQSTQLSEVSAGAPSMRGLMNPPGEITHTVPPPPTRRSW